MQGTPQGLSHCFLQVITKGRGDNFCVAKLGLHSAPLFLELIDTIPECTAIVCAMPSTTCSIWLHELPMP